MNLSDERASEESGGQDSLEDNESPNPVKNKLSSLFNKFSSTKKKEKIEKLWH